MLDVDGYHTFLGNYKCKIILGRDQKDGRKIADISNFNTFSLLFIASKICT